MDDTLYDRVGGAPFFERLVDAFYAAVEIDELLRPMYPPDLADSKRHMMLFLVQYWGGPTSYGDERGHPRLRMRHAPFHITKEARDAWVAAMMSALGEVRSELTRDQHEEMTAYFEMVATQLRNE